MHKILTFKRWMLLLTLCLVTGSVLAQPTNWQSNWAIPPGFFLEVDTSGYEIPVSIAFVPNPGTEPDAPLYYVAELGGRIMVVRNDRKVEVFAENFFDLTLSGKMPDLSGILGLTGLCLDAGTGYLFATYVYDGDQGRYNGVTRFTTKPEEFSLAPTGALHIHKPFTLGNSDFTRLPYGHQIGACQIIENKLYVGIGDGEITYRSRSDQSSFGKILRMNFDGSPIDATGDISVGSYIFASGLRNPFGQTQVGKNIVVADNGPGVDRVLIVREGKDYLYDGSDASIALNSMAVLSPAKGTANITFYPADSKSGIEKLGNHVLVVLSGIPEVYIKEEPAEILAFEVEEESALVTSRPRSLVKYVGNKLQVLSSIALGDDGVYFSPVYGDNGLPGGSNVYRLSWAPEKSYPTSLRQYSNAGAILRNYGCRGCHAIRGKGGNVGPSLNPKDLRERNLMRLNSQQYASMLVDMNSKDKDGANTAARKRVLALEGEQRLSAWIQEKIMEPMFDSEHSAMPLLSVPKREARILAKFLLQEKKVKAAVKKPPPQ